MHDFKPGQRWICDVDLQLGLGIIQTVEHRVIRIAFKAVNEIRSYARLSAPLTRVIFKVGDTISSHEGITLKVTQINEYNGLIVYSGISKSGDWIELAEGQLAHHLQLNRPTERLFT
ncbi:MAG: RNA polymerase-associated protein RapA, partial [Nitrosomonas sp.]|nr:RNA polymerase-associated protein RapA [Nitrosomonas sp.]